MAQRPETLEQAFKAMPEFANSDAIQGVDKTIQFVVTGDEPGKYVVDIADGEVNVEEGTTDAADATITTPSDVWMGIITGDINGAMAFMQGKFKADGDLNVLMNMQKWFDTP